MLAVPATKHGTLLHHAVMLQLSDATRALLLAGDFVVSDKKLELQTNHRRSFHNHGEGMPTLPMLLSHGTCGFMNLRIYDESMLTNLSMPYDRSLLLRTNFMSTSHA